MADYINTAINNVALKITDLVFLEIQNNRELMHAYLKSIENEGLQSVNMEIGKRVLQRFHLEKIESRGYNPVSVLIQSYQEYETK